MPYAMSSSAIPPIIPHFVRFKYVAGGVTLLLGMRDPANQIFDFIPDDGGERIVLHIRTLQNLITTRWSKPPATEVGAQNLPYCFPRIKDIGPEAATMVIQRNGVDMGYIGKITRGSPTFNDPGIICMFDPKNRPNLEYPFEEQVVDGSHRLVARVIAGERTMHFFMVPKPIWRLAQLEPGALVLI